MELYLAAPAFLRARRRAFSATALALVAAAASSS
jgi:hypothetical protein